MAQDSSRPDFWDARFRSGVTPWDAAGVPAPLQAWIKGRPPCRVLVPGCGTGYEVGLFAALGHDVLGIEFSDAALEAAAVFDTGLRRQGALAGVEAKAMIARQC